MDGERLHQGSSPSVEADEHHSVSENDHSIESEHVTALVDTNCVDNERDDTTPGLQTARHDVITVELSTAHRREIDKLQTQLIAREQTVTELNEQLNEMHAERAKMQEQMWDKAEELRRRWSNIATQHNVLYERLQLCERSLRLKNNELAEAARKIHVLERERDYTEIALTAKVGSRSDQCMGHSDQLHSASVRPEVAQLPSCINSRSTPVESRPFSPTFHSKAQLPSLVLARETNVSVQQPDLGVAALLQQMALTQQTLATSLSSPSFSPHRALDAQAMPRFSGDLSERSFDHWEADFVDFTLLVGASTDQQKLWWLKCALKDLALKYFDNLPTIVRNDYNESMAKLKAQFVNTQSLMSAMTVFTSRTMQPNKLVMEFGTVLERLSRPTLIKMDAKSADSMLTAIFSRNILEQWQNASLHKQDNASFEQRFRSMIQEEQRVKAFKALGLDKEGKKKPTDQANHLYSQMRKFSTNPDKASHPN
uniref:Uncharacterized protein n=1 Tax=Plectus sambesii TaxID=2011161 RepID=A0A914UN72_9BILA